MNSLRPHSPLARWIALAGLAFIVPACGGPAEDRVPVYRTSGKITFEGKPLANAVVYFRKPEIDPKVPSPFGTTGEDGTFTLHTYEPADGAPAGDYLVGVTIRPPNRDTGGGSMSKKGPIVDVLQGRYGDPKTSGLKATIKPTDNTLETIDLTPSGGAVPGYSPSRGDR